MVNFTFKPFNKKNEENKLIMGYFPGNYLTGKPLTRCTQNNSEYCHYYSLPILTRYEHIYEQGQRWRNQPQLMRKFSL